MKTTTRRKHAQQTVDKYYTDNKDKGIAGFQRTGRRAYCHLLSSVESALF